MATAASADLNDPETRAISSLRAGRPSGNGSRQTVPPGAAEPDFLQSIDLIYEAAVDPSRWSVSLEARARGSRALLPHVERAIAIQQRISRLVDASNAAHELLDRLTFGVLLLDQRGRAVLMNAVADDILRIGDGLTLASDGRLVAVQASMRAKLAGLVGEVCRAGRGGTVPGGSVLVRRSSGLRPLALLLAPLRSCDGAVSACPSVAAAFISDPERPSDDPHALLQGLYQFTRAESRVAWLLIQGRRVSEIAADLSITEQTARCHLKRILSKAGCRSQSDLIRVLCRGPAALRLAKQ